MMVNGAFVVCFVLLFGVRSSVAANSVTLDVSSASGSCGQGLPSILDRDAAMMAATLCRVKRGLPLPEVGPLVCFQLVSAATLAAAGAAPCWAWETERFFLLPVFGDAMTATLCCVMRGLPLLEVGPLFCFQVAGLAPCWAVEADRILNKFESGGICSCSACSSGSGIGVPLDCLVSLCIPGGFWIETDSLVFFVDDCSCCFPWERIKITEALSLLVYGYLLSSQVMYGIQEAAAACHVLAFALFLVYVVGRQLQPAARTFAGMLVLNVSEIGASLVEGLFAFGCLDEWEGESLLAGNSPVGTGEQASGRLDVPGEKQIGAAAAAAAAAASGCPPPQVQNENETWQILVTSLSGRSVSLQVSLSIDHDCLVDLLADRTGVRGLGGVRMGFGREIVCGWLGVCLVVLVLLLFLFRVSGRARRAVWRVAGLVKCDAFGAWLRGLSSMGRTRLVQCLGRAMRGNVRIRGNLPLRRIRRIRLFGICLVLALQHLGLWVLLLQRLLRRWI